MRNTNSESRSLAVGAAKPIWLLIFGIATSFVVANFTTGIGFLPKQITWLTLILIAVGGLTAFYTFVRPEERIARLARAGIELFLLSFLCGGLSYAVTSLNRPLWDEIFASWDQTIGFDWRFCLGVLNDHPKLNLVLVMAYHSMLPELAVVLVALVTVRDYRRIDVFLLAFGLAAVITVTIAGLMPALGPIVHFGITPTDHPNIGLGVSTELQIQTLGLRTGAMRIIDLSDAQGLVTFPSFHTVAAVLLLLGFRQVPYLRWLSFVLNGLMLIAVPIEGNHYLVDLIAGLVVALVSWWFGRAIVQSMDALSTSEGKPLRAERFAQF